MLPVEEKNDLYPVCPHCGQELKKIFCRRLQSFLGKRYIYFLSALPENARRFASQRILDGVGVFFKPHSALPLR